MWRTTPLVPKIMIPHEERKLCCLQCRTDENIRQGASAYREKKDVFRSGVALPVEASLFLRRGSLNPTPHTL